MSSPFKNHVASLNQSFIQKFIATFCSFARFSTSRQKYTTLLVLNGHEIGWYFNIDDIAAIAVTLKIIHEEIMSIVHKKV